MAFVQQDAIKAFADTREAEALNQDLVDWKRQDEKGKTAWAHDSVYLRFDKGILQEQFEEIERAVARHTFIKKHNGWRKRLG